MHKDRAPGELGYNPERTGLASISVTRFGQWEGSCLGRALGETVSARQRGTPRTDAAEAGGNTQSTDSWEMDTLAHVAR